MPLFRNHQWAVTETGITVLEPANIYPDIAATRLTEMSGAGRGKFYDWPVHMVEKTWVDPEAFIEAYVKAVELHGARCKPPADPAIVARSFAEARRVAANR